MTSVLPNANGLTAGPAAKYLQWIVFNKPEWKYNDLNFDSDVIFADTNDAEGPQINAIDPNLSGFQKRHGKLISYHGWVDPGFTPEFNVQYYERVIEHIGQGPSCQKRGRGVERTRRISTGFSSCLEWDIARVVPAPMRSVASRSQPCRWTRSTTCSARSNNGWSTESPPAQIIATKYVKDDPKQGVAMQRPVCPYPQEAEYKGHGSTTDPTNFACVNETRNLKLSASDRIQVQPVPKR